MRRLKRWLVTMSLGGTLLVGLTNCVVAPGPPGYVVSPPVVVIRPYRHYHPRRPYHPHHHHRHYYGRYPHAYRW
jgi:hypothetical protein